MPPDIRSSKQKKKQGSNNPNPNSNQGSNNTNTNPNPNPNLNPKSSPKKPSFTQVASSPPKYKTLGDAIGTPPYLSNTYDAL